MANLHVLVAEDDPDIRELLALQLRKDGFDVETVADGARAIEAIDRRKPDVLLTDLRMPGADGLDVCCAMRDAYPGDLTPALIITGSVLDNERLREALAIPGVMMSQKPLRVKSLGKLLIALSEHWHSESRLTDDVHVAAELVDDDTRTLPGEDLATDDPQSAAHWLATYTDLLNFKRFMLDEVEGRLQRAMPETRFELEQTDLPFLHREHERFRKRAGFWQKRCRDLRAA